MAVIFSETALGKMNRIDIITSDRGIYVHKQIEFKDGLLFMRAKKRNIPVHA